MSDAECPYCTRSIEIYHDDGYGYAEDETHEQECEHCGKMFTYTTYIHFTYDTKQAPCLNGGEHKFKSNPIYPFFPENKRCVYCDHQERGKYQKLEDIDVKRD